MTPTDNVNAPDHAAGAHGGRLPMAFALTAGYFLVELVGAYVVGSLALLADAAHMFADASALAIALAAIRVGRQSAADRRTFGYRRFQVLAAGCNAVLLFAVALYVIYAGVLRALSPQPVGAPGMVALAAGGLIVNLICMRLLAEAAEPGRTVWDAVIEVLGSVAVVVAGVLIWLTGWAWIDPLVAIAVALWVAPRAWTLVGEATSALLNGIPTSLSIPEIRTALMDVAGVRDVHDLHLWATDNAETQGSAHVVLTGAADAETARLAVVRVLNDFGVKHVTVQVEAPASAPARLGRP